MFAIIRDRNGWTQYVRDCSGIDQFSLKSGWGNESCSNFCRDSSEAISRETVLHRVTVVTVTVVTVTAVTVTTVTVTVSTVTVVTITEVTVVE